MHTKNIPVKNVKLENISVIDYIKKSYDEMKLSMKHSNYPFTHFCMELGIKPSLIFNFVAKKDVNYDVILSNHKFQLIHIKRKDCDNVITVQIGFRDSNYEIRVESSNAITNEKKLRLISESMKNESDTQTTVIRGDGPLEGMTCVADYGFKVRAYPLEPVIPTEYHKPGKIIISFLLSEKKLPNNQIPLRLIIVIINTLIHKLMNFPISFHLF